MSAEKRIMIPIETTIPKSDTISGFPVIGDNCAGCGKPLEVENAWMTDGCPCNSPLGVNSMNETRWRLLMDLQQRQSRENESLAKFKAYVHARLDTAGVPTDPDSQHKAEGCRIGGRLDIVLAGAVLGIGQSGVGLIHRERLRQIHEDHRGARYTAEHDDQHTDGSILVAAGMIAMDVSGGTHTTDPELEHDEDAEWTERLAAHVQRKYADDPIRRLAIAGAMIAAEIDRLQRAVGK